MKPAPKQIGGASVICFAVIDSRVQPTNNDGLASLNANPSWQALEPHRAGSILEDAGVHPLSAPALATEADLLAALDKLPIKGLEDRLAALPSRLSAVLTEALSKLEPESVIH
jgi:hypothetical protein